MTDNFEFGDAGAELIPVPVNKQHSFYTTRGYAIQRQKLLRNPAGAEVVRLIMILGRAFVLQTYAWLQLYHQHVIKRHDVI